MAKEKLPFRVAKGCLVPADGFTEARLRSRRYSIGDIVFCVITKPRNPAFNNLVHKFGELIAQNIGSFTGKDPHTVLKCIQLEADIACEYMSIKLNGMWVQYRVPKSLSFESMGEEEFSHTFRKFSTYIAEEYWPDMSAEQIEEMAKLMPEDV